ncbi:MAG: fructose-6-phosphate aldolase [Chloroflexi bacterium]|nr:fructose-6-phosphate aldolase [Chloroflexota bacterium]
MKIFLDTANLDEIREIAAWGILSGVTTNPSLLAKEQGADFRETIAEICRLVNGPVSAEVIATDVPGVLAEAREYAAWHPNVVVKIPLTPNGISAVSILAREGIKTNVTLCFSANQALLAALAGATFVSPFVGRLDDISEDGMALIRDIVKIFRNYAYIKTHVLAASIRHPRHLVEAALAGADVATVPTAVLKQAIKHPLTDAGLEKFLSDWNKRSTNHANPRERLENSRGFAKIRG